MIKPTHQKFLALVIIVQLAFAPVSFAESPWVKNDSVGGKIAGKFGYGLKNSLLGWTSMFIEAVQPEYKTEWNGFCVGIARTVVYTGGGLVQLATFPIPVDFPDMGPGLHIPQPRDTYTQTIGINKNLPHNAPPTKSGQEEDAEVKAPVAEQIPATSPAPVQEAVVYEVKTPVAPAPTPEPVVENKDAIVPPQPKVEETILEAPTTTVEEKSAEPAQQLDKLESDLDKLIDGEDKTEPAAALPSAPTTPAAAPKVKMEDLFPDGKPKTAPLPSDEVSETEESKLEDSLFAEDEELFKEMDAELEKTIQKTSPESKKSKEISDYTAR